MELLDINFFIKVVFLWLFLPSHWQVAKHRRDLQLESANKEYDNAIQTAMNDFEESIRSTRERLRDRLNETVCNLQVEFMMVRRAKRRSHASSSTGKCTQFSPKYCRRST